MQIFNSSNETEFIIAGQLKMQFDLSASHCLVKQILFLAMLENVGQSIARLRRAISYEGIFKRTNIFSVRLKMHFDLPGAQDTALLSRTIVFFLK